MTTTSSQSGGGGSQGQTYILQLAVVPTGGGILHPAAGAYILKKGSPLGITAFHSPGWHLDHWLVNSSAVTQISNMTLIAWGDSQVTAVFAQDGSLTGSSTTSSQAPILSEGLVAQALMVAFFFGVVAMLVQRHSRKRA
jgi:hypothetical protein